MDALAAVAAAVVTPVHGNAGQRSELEAAHGTVRAAEARCLAVKATLGHADSDGDLPVLCDIGAATPKVSNVTRLPRESLYAQPLTRIASTACTASERPHALVCQLTALWMRPHAAEHFSQGSAVLASEP